MADVRRIAERSLELLARDCPWHWDRLGRALAGQRLEIRIDGGGFALVAERGEPRIIAQTTAPTAVLRTERGVLRELIQGERSLLRAIEDDSLDVRGAVPDLLALSDCLLIYVAGALRSPEHLELLDELRGTGS